MVGFIKILFNYVYFENLLKSSADKTGIIIKFKKFVETQKSFRFIIHFQVSHTFIEVSFAIVVLYFQALV
jgi:hypothetical protein